MGLSTNRSRVTHDICVSMELLAHADSSDKNTRLMAKLEILSKRTLTQKILSLLSFEAQRAGSLYFTLPMNRDEMAEYLCVNRSALSRELSLMKDKGLIDYDRNTFRILRSGEEA